MISAIQFTRIEKQYRDLRASLEDRLIHVGLSKKHETVTPNQGISMGRGHLMNRAPAGLVAGRYYPTGTNPTLKTVARVSNGCGCDDGDNDQAICLTESLRGFLAWKEKGGKLAPSASPNEVPNNTAVEQNEASVGMSTATEHRDELHMSASKKSHHRNKSVYNAHQFYVQVQENEE